MELASSSSTSGDVLERRGIPAAKNVKALANKLVEMKRLAPQWDLQALVTDYEVSEGIFSWDCIDDTDSVCLWLGANVILEYSFDEATSLLQKNLDNAKAGLEMLVVDSEFLRDQVTTARVYNLDVHQRRHQRASSSINSLNKMRFCYAFRASEVESQELQSE